MSFRPVSLSKFCGLLFLLVVSAFLKAQTTTINVNGTAVQSTVQRLGINLGQQAFYDSGQMMKNLVFTNPSFEGEIYQSTVECGQNTYVTPNQSPGSATSCTDANIYSGWTGGFWNGASYTVISGSAVGRTGTICSYSPVIWNGTITAGVFNFCDSGTAPGQGDYIVVKRTMPASLGWPAGDWQTVAGNGALTPETTDLPPGTLGKQSALLTAPTAADSIGMNMFFDSTTGKTFLQLNGSYQLTFKAKGVAGAKNIAILLTRAGAGATYVSQTVALSGAWQTYTINFNAAENGTDIGKVELSFTAAGPDTVELDDVSLVKTGTDPTNTTVFRDEVVNSLQALHPGVLRMWEDQLGESLDNLLAGPTGKQRSAYTPYNGFDGTDVNFQTQTLEFGLTDFLQLCQKVGADPWIVVPSTFSTGEAYSLIDYLAGSSSTPYGAIRAAAGQTAPWTSVFHQIHLEFGNEEWNGGTFKGGAIEVAPSYGQAGTNIFAAMKSNTAFSAPSFDLIVDGQSANPGGNQYLQGFITNNNSFSIAPYMMYNINDFDSVDHLFGTTFAEAEAFVAPSCAQSYPPPADCQYDAEGVDGGFITDEQVFVGKPIVTSEMNLSPSSGTLGSANTPNSQATLDGYASSVGGGIAVIDAMMQQLRAGVRTQNLFELPGYVSNTAQNPANTMFLWGAVVDMGATNRVRPQYLALQLANKAIGSATTEVQTVHTGADPTDNQYNFALNTVTLPTFHFLQSFAFTASDGSKSLVVFNVNPDNPEPVNFAGTNAPSGTVTMQQLTSAHITDTNESSSVVATTSQTLPSFNASNTITLPAYSMTVFTWGGTTTAPAITSVQATSVSPTSETITWTTDQPSTSVVNYGASTSYGSQSSSATLVTSHSVTLTGLTASTTYDFDVVSVNGSSLSSNSSNSTFTTAAVPPTISAVAVSNITATGATITWTTNQSSSSSVSYGTTTNYSSSATGTGNVTSHSVALTGLTPGTTYDFDVTSANSANASASSNNSTFTTLTAPPVISNVVTTAVAPTIETITWTTDQASTSVVNYGATTSYGSQMSSSTLVTSHSITLTGLTQSTTYQFDVVSVNATSQSTPSANSNFLTQTPSPTITNIAVSSITATGATITWTTDLASSSQVYYGLTTSYNTQSALNSTLVTSHSVALTGLTAGTLYDLQVASTNNPGGTTLSSNASFTTLTNPPVISNVVATGVTPTSETITWTTDEPSTSQVSFGTTMSYGTSTTVNSTLTTTHSVTLTTGLAQSTMYDFVVISANAANQSITSSNFTFTTLTPAPTITNVASSAITATGATITWTTDLPSSSQVFYGTTTGYGSSSTLNSTLVTSHSVVLTGLTAGTTYDFDVASTNNPGGTNTSANNTFATLTNPPAITNVASSGITTTSATITWTTDEPSSSQVSYGTTMAYGTLTSVNNTLVTTHSVTISGLTQSTMYDFAVISANAASQSTTSTNNTLLTATPAPVISNIQMTNLTTTGVTITWNTDLASSTTVNYGTTPSYGSSMAGTGGVTSHSVTLSSLTPGTGYSFDVVSTNSPGGTATSANFTFTTVNVPPTISAVTATNVTANSAIITWTTNEPSSSQVNFGLTTSYNNTTTLNSTLVTTHSVTLTGLPSGTLFDFDVVSANSSSQSTTSGNFTFTTTAVPPVISNVTVSAITTTGATITWATDEASSSSVSYGTTTGYGSTMAGANGVTGHQVVLTGLTPGTTYDFDVTSANTGNGSATSGNFTFATNPVPPTITNVTATNITSIGATITWTTDQTSSSSVSYGTTTSYGTSATGAGGVTTHSVTITGLTPGTTYDFDVTSANATTTLSATSGNSSFITVAAPIITSVATGSTTSIATTITWTTDQPASSQVFYGTTTSYGSSSTLNSTLVTAHSVTINGLTPGTTYDFKVTSVNGSTASSSSGNSTFATTPAPVISNVQSTGINSISATITWNTDEASSSQVNYGTSTAYGTSSTLNSTPVMAHSVTINGLTPGTTYDFDVVSVNSSTASTTSGNFTFATTPAPAITAVAVSAITTTGATISWTTDQASSSVVNYGTTTSYGSTTTGTGGVTSHSVTLTGLSSGTTYDFIVTSVNGSTASSSSTNSTFVTTAVAPVISGVVVSASTTTTATINWTTDQPSTSQVFFGTTMSYGSSSVLNTTLTTAHSVTITGLSPAITYDFDVASTNSFSLTATSANSTFTTPQGTPPQVGYVAAWGISNNGAVVTWSTDVVATTQLAYGTTPALGQLSPLDLTLAASHGVTLSGLIPGTQYYFQAQSTGANGATGSSALMTFTTTGTAPAGPPVISNVVVSNITNTSATITWTTDQASSSLVNFGTTSGYGSATTLDSNLVTSHTVNLTGLTLGTTYDFDVVSANAGAMSAHSANATFLTTSVVSNPPVISNVTTTNLTSTSVTVNWTTDQPASSLVNYGTTMSYGSSSPVVTTLVTAHSVTLTGLAAGTAYNFDVVSANAASQSTPSSNGTFNTPATTATPPNVGYVVAWGINNSGAVVTWSTDVLASTQLVYGTTPAMGLLSGVDSTLAASHGVTLSNLVSGTTYYFQAQSIGANGATGYSTVMTFTTTGTAPAGPPVISNVVVSAITNTSAMITWTTDQASTSKVNFGLTAGYGSSTALDSNLVTSHSVTLSGLTLGTTYDFDVVSANAGAMSATSGNSTFLTTSVVSTPPVITLVSTTNLTSTSVTVTWTTNQPANSQVNYGTTTSYTSSTTLDSNLVTAHSETITGLTAGTAYNFDVVSINGAAQPTTSPNATFSTPATTATPPNVGYIAAWGISNTGAVVTWSTDVQANTQLAYGTSPVMGQLSPLQTALSASHGVTLSGLNPGTLYYYQCQSTANGATGYSPVMTFTTTGTQTTPPPTITSVTATAITNTSATITWTTDQPSSSLVNYGATTTYNLSSTIDPTLVTSHSVLLTGLTPGTLYNLDVVSANSLALSSTSPNTTFSTTGTAPGPVISNITTSGVMSGTATISWMTDQASTSVVNYGTTASYGTTSSMAPLVTTHSVTLTGLTPNTTYDFDVSSANSGNTMTTSTNFTFKTTSNSAPPPVISFLSFWGVTATEATVTWSTDTLANSAVAYGTSPTLGQLSPVQAALTNSHGVTLTGLTPGTTYYFAAQSADSGGNTGSSATLSFTTIQGPPTISGVTSHPAANNTATINWTTSAPTNSYVQYGMSAGSYGFYTAQTTLTTTPNCTLTYVPSGTVHYQLVSTDANGNQVISPDMTFVEP